MLSKHHICASINDGKPSPPIENITLYHLAPRMFRIERMQFELAKEQQYLEALAKEMKGYHLLIWIDKLKTRLSKTSRPSHRRQAMNEEIAKFQDFEMKFQDYMLKNPHDYGNDNDD